MAGRLGEAVRGWRWWLRLAFGIAGRIWMLPARPLGDFLEGSAASTPHGGGFRIGERGRGGLVWLAGPSASEGIGFRIREWVR